MIIDFSKCAVLECYKQKPYTAAESRADGWAPEWKFDHFEFFFPYKGDWLCIARDYRSIDWDNPIFIANDIGHFLDPEYDIIKFLPADLAKKLINIWIAKAQRYGMTWYMQSSFQAAKRLARQLQEVSERTCRLMPECDL